MNFEALLLRSQQEEPILMSISPINPTYFQNYLILIEFNDQKLEFKASNLFDCFHDFLSHVITVYNDPTIKLKFAFDIYFESRFKSKSKARQLISNHHLLISIICSSRTSRYFEEDHDLEIHGEAVFEDRTITLEGPEIEQLFEQLYYGLKDTEEIRICLYCKHYGRFPGTKIHPSYCSSVCYKSKSNIHEFYRQNAPLLDEILAEIIPDLLKQSQERGNIDEVTHIADSIEQINKIIDSDKKLKEKIADCETLIHTLSELPRKLPIETCNYWEKRSR